MFRRTGAVMQVLSKALTATPALTCSTETLPAPEAAVFRF
jgi:hypothetical protein